MGILKVYIDNNVCSAITKKDHPNEIAAIQLLLEWDKTGKIDLGTSRQSIREMERVPANYQQGLKQGISGLDIAKGDHRVLGFHTQTDWLGGCISNPLVSDIIDETLYSKLRAAGLDDNDSKHLIYAVHNGFERFLTLDHDFFTRQGELRILCRQVAIARPSEFVAETLKDHRVDGGTRADGAKHIPVNPYH